MIWPLVVLLLVAAMPGPVGAVTASGSELGEEMLVSGDSLPESLDTAGDVALDEFVPDTGETDASLDEGARVDGEGGPSDEVLSDDFLDDGGVDAEGAEAFPEGVDERTDSREESDTGLDALLEEDLVEDLETEDDLSAEEELLTSGGEGAVMVESAGENGIYLKCSEGYLTSAASGNGLYYAGEPETCSKWRIRDEVFLYNPNAANTSGTNTVPVISSNIYQNGSRISFADEYVILQKTAVDAEGNELPVRIGVIGFAGDFASSIMYDRFTGDGAAGGDADAPAEKANALGGRADAPGGGGDKGSGGRRDKGPRRGRDKRGRGDIGPGGRGDADAHQRRRKGDELGSGRSG